MGYLYGTHMAPAKFCQQRDLVMDWLEFRTIDNYDDDFRMDEHGNICVWHMDDSVWIPKNKSWCRDIVLDKLHRMQVIYPMKEGSRDSQLGVTKEWCPKFSVVKCYVNVSLEEAARKYDVLIAR